jgi:hypothetical protein
MSIDFSQYRHPGVYVDAGTNPTLATAGVAPTVICLVGSGVGYNTFVETISFASASSVALTKHGINPASIQVRGYITDPNASGQSIPYLFQADVGITPHDYSVTTNTSGGAENSTTTITKTGGGKIESAYPQVTVSYQYTDASYHALNFFDDYTSISDTYGPAFDPTTGALVSPLTFAAGVAVLNGANQIYAIALNPATGTVAQQFSEAYQTLSANNTNVNLVVPLFDGVTDQAALGGMLATLNAALQADAVRGVLRVGVCGLDQSYAGSIANVASLGSGINSPRVVLAYPNALEYYNGVLNQTQTVDGFYLAAAYAGVLAKQDPQMPLTHKTIQGFSAITSSVLKTLTSTNKDTLAKGGIAIVEPDRAGRLRVRHGLTTAYAGGVLNREISLVRSQDALYNLLQDTMENSGLIGIPIDDTTALRVKSIVSGALETAKSSGSGLITDYSQLAVRQQSPPSGDPTVIDVRFAYKPPWPLNYILVSFTVDTSNSNSSITNLTATAA